jgi:hypothetical protein
VIVPRGKHIRHPARLPLNAAAALRAGNDAAAAELAAEGYERRPRNRADCRSGERPCPWASCRHHMALDVNPNGTLVLNFPGLEIWELAHTCSLDGADEGGMTLEELGKRLNVVRERARQLEVRALERLREAVGRVID